MASTSTSLDRHILAITEPTIKLDPIQFKDMHEGDSKGPKQSRENGSWAPYIKINNITIEPGEIESFTLNAGGFMPIISFTFTDLKRVFHLDSLPRDGDVISVRIASKQEDTFKDIRADFDITSFIGNAGLNINPNEARTYMVSGILKVPTLMAETCFSYSSNTSIEHLKKIATELKLGFASNIDAADDKMTRLCPYMSKLSFIKGTIDHSYVDEDSFQVGSIDPYYYLNFVNLNKLFNSHNELENTIINMFGVDWNVNPGDENALNKLKAQMVLSNHKDWGGTSQFITSYQIINNSTAISLSNGYSRKLQYFENNSNEKLVSFDVQPLSSKKMKEIEEPMKGRRDEDRYKNETKQKYVGRIDADPQHGNINHNYFYASIHNKMNLNEVHKMKLEIHLDTINPGLYRYMKIPVLIFSQTLQENNLNRNVTQIKEEKGFASEGKDIKTENADPNNLNAINKQSINELLSGFYIIDDMSYVYDPDSPTLFYQKITLLRREWPSRLNNI